MTASKKDYSLWKKTAAAQAYYQNLQEFETELNKADQTDYKIKYDVVCKLKKMTEW